MTCRTGLGLLLATLATSAGSLAWAEEPSEGAEPTAKPAPVSEVNVAAAEQPAGGQPATTVTVGADKAEQKKEELPPRVPWRGTTFVWQNAASSAALGIGDDYQSSSFHQYTMSFGGTINYYVVDEDKLSVTLRLTPSASTELTNSDSTTTRNEPWFNDLPLTAGIGYKLFSHEAGWATTVGARGGFIFPTSPGSYEAGTHLTTTLSLSLLQSIPLLGKDAPLLKSIAISLGGRWDHRFSEATTAVNPDLDRPRMLATGETFLSDQLSGGALSMDKVYESATLSFSEDILGTTLDLDFELAAIHSFKPGFEGSDCEVQLLTGCVKAASEEDVRTSFNTIGFGVTATYYPMSEFGLRLAYANASTQLGPDGKRRSVFFSPDAGFEATLLVSLDAIYERIVGPPRSDPYMLARNQNQNPKPQQQPRQPGRALTMLF